jgi:protein-S-isoprenylcysteine O-methyltransferase Ste14
MDSHELNNRKEFTMTTETNVKPTNKYTLTQLIVSCIMTAIFFPGLILLLGGDLGWVEGWLFGLWFAAMVLSSTIYLYFYDPALLAERSRAPGSGNQKRWDAYLLTAIYIIALIWLVILPLDARRFGWSPAFPLWLKVVGGVMLIPALYFIFRATVENTFMSTLVRIQSDRKQHVISTGVYGFVRHPLYFGCLLMMVGGPLLVGSGWGLIITAGALVLLVARIMGEEKMLVNELEGYDEYKTKVKYRLVPFVW